MLRERLEPMWTNKCFCAWIVKWKHRRENNEAEIITPRLVVNKFSVVVHRNGPIAYNTKVLVKYVGIFWTQHREWFKNAQRRLSWTILCQMIICQLKALGRTIDSFDSQGFRSKSRICFVVWSTSARNFSLHRTVYLSYSQNDCKLFLKWCGFVCGGYWVLPFDLSSWNHPNLWIGALNY